MYPLFHQEVKENLSSQGNWVIKAKFSVAVHPSFQFLGIASKLFEATSLTVDQPHRKDVKAITIMTTILINLPNEILLKVLSCLRAKDPEPKRTANGDWNITVDDWHNEDYPSLKSLRVVDKQLSSICTPVLFESVVMLRHPDSWRKLNSICRSRLAPLVRVIELAAYENLPNYDSVEKWEKQTPFEQILVDTNATRKQRYKMKYFWANPTAGGPVADVDLSTRRKGYARYKYWLKGETAMETHIRNGTAPSLRLDLLTNLKRFEIVGVRELATVKLKISNEPMQTPFPNTARWIGRTFATRRAIESSCEDQPPHLCAAQWAHVALLLRAAGNRGVDITNLTLWDFQDLYRAKIPAGIAFPSLRQLTLELQGNINALRIRLPPWLPTLANLTNLIIVQHRVIGHTDIFWLFLNIVFPRLAKLDATRVVTSARALERFILAHARTLQYLRIIDPIIVQADWLKFREKYAGARGFRTVELEGSGFVPRNIPRRIGS